MTCQGRDEGIAIQYGKDGQCLSILAKSALEAKYIDDDHKEKGFSLIYGQGDFCEAFWKEREVRFDYHCDWDIDFEVRQMVENQCTYHFSIYTKQACHLLAP